MAEPQFPAVDRLVSDAQRRRAMAVMEQEREKARILKEIQANDKPLEDPWIDPVSAFAGGFGGALPNALRRLGTMGLKALMRPAVSGAAGAAADIPIGAATEKIGEKVPGAALPFNILAGMGSGVTLERALEEIVTDPKRAYRLAQRTLLNDMGMFGGDIARTADKSALDAAKTLEAEGDSMEAIRRQTGWFKGMDDKWRFEIDDSKAKIDLSKISDNPFDPNNLQTKLPDVFEHPTLYESYPELRDVSVMNSNISGERAAFMPGRTEPVGIITINKELAPNSEEAKQSLLHEIQHAVQEIEGFARGGNPADPFLQGSPELAEIIKKEDLPKARAAVNNATTQDEYDAAQKKLAEINAALANASESSMSKYRRLAGEIEARDTAARADFNEDWRRNMKPYESQGIPREQAIIRFGR